MLAGPLRCNAMGLPARYDKKIGSVVIWGEGSKVASAVFYENGPFSSQPEAGINVFLIHIAMNYLSGPPFSENSTNSIEQRQEFVLLLWNIVKVYLIS